MKDLVLALIFTLSASCEDSAISSCRYACPLGMVKYNSHDGCVCQTQQTLCPGAPAQAK